MPRFLVLFASTHGHTQKIARRIASVLRDQDIDVVCRPIAEAADELPSDYDGVVIGASVHAGSHQREAVDWIRHHPISLTKMPSAFFSVSLSAADEDEAAQARTREWIDDLLDDTGWRPSFTAAFAGALQYREYGWPTRLALMAKMARDHHPTDITRDHDFTDWSAVDEFARRVADLARVFA